MPGCGLGQATNKYEATTLAGSKRVDCISLGANRSTATTKLVSSQ